MQDKSRKKQELSLYSWNVRSLRARFFDMYALIDETNPHILCLSEVKLSPNEHINIYNYNIHINARNSHGGGTAILIRKDIIHEVPSCENFIAYCKENNVDIAIVFLNLTENRKIFIITIYSPPRSGSGRTVNDFWEEFFSFCLNLGEVIIVGDFNGHADL